jgi:ATP-binding cassette subfamily B protein
MPPHTVVTPPELTENERARASGARTLRKVAPYLWPADKAWVKRRVVWAMIALVVS